MATTPNYALPLPSDATYVADLALVVREQSTTVDSVLKTQGTSVQASKTAAQQSAVSAAEAAALVGTPAGAVVLAAVNGPGDVRESLEKNFQMDRPGAFGSLQARLAAREISPVPIVFVGSSTTWGHTTDWEKRWITMLGQRSTLNKVLTRVEANAMPSLPTGVVLVNAGNNGANSENYINTGTATQIASWEPALVVHMIGSNDWASNLNPATYEANIRERIGWINAASPLPIGHLLVHSYARFDKTGLANTWDDYRERLKVIARDLPNVSVADISREFAAIGIPSTDPLALTMPDRIHLNDDGHRVMLEIMATRLALPERAPMTPTTVILDRFQRADGLATRADTGQPWIGASGNGYIQNGAMGGGPTSMTVLADSGLTDMDVSAIAFFPNTTITAVGGVLFRSLNDLNRNGIFIDQANKELQLYRRVNGSQRIVARTTIADPGISDHQLRAVVQGAAVTVFYEGRKVLEYTYSTADVDLMTGWTFAGLRSAYGSEPLWRNFHVQTV